MKLINAFINYKYTALSLFYNNEKNKQINSILKPRPLHFHKLRIPYYLLYKTSQL